MDEGETFEVNADYLKILQEHVDSTYDHLQGFNPSAGIPFASYYAHRSFWTSEEKDIFFHGLAVHSKLRPDLIAADLPNKTAVDVLLFLDLLEKASKEERGRFSRKSFAPALETSGKWTEWEEEQARRISINQPFWEDRRRRKERARSVRAEWPSYEPSKRRRLSGNAAQEDEKPFLDRMHAQWNKEDYLKDLSVLHLRAIDHILRESEEPVILEAGKYTIEDIKEEDGLEGQSLVDPCIDPSLLETPAKQNIEKPVVPVEDGPTGDRQTLSPVVDDEENVEDPRALSPRSRRRYRKRLYMRRKRATLNGAAPSTAVTRLKPGRKTSKNAVITLPDPVDEDDENNGENEEALNASGLIEGAFVTSQGAGGVTPHYKIIQELNELGVNASTLAEDRLGLFHLTNIGKLMEIYASLDASSTSSDIGSCISASTIQLLHALVTHFVTNAIGMSISMREQEQASKGHTKVWRMNSGQIPASTVREAVDLMGAQMDVKQHFKALQERVKSTFAQSAPASREPSIADNEDLSASEEEEADGEKPTEMHKTLLLSSHRQLYCPVVRLDPSTSTQFSPFFRPQDINACLEMDGELLADETDEEELQRELDEEEDVDKLDEIAAQDAEQELWLRVQLEAPHVQSIPNRASPTASEAPASPESPSKGTNKSKALIEGEWGKLRFSNPGRKGIIKSTVYVDDSD
ncbi:hypothetical protein SCHPADRAFT_993334 [Schizopora paradoxa]|uniref:Myb-like domain-containing protein n=1 Tax=Schizopora paradoxa TaxID=27342 RepID=A0A0H2S2Y7_9AGAM|nr:hypothetical protein SCHPADRAFT_993334 [Schizopora paradoxa]